jgi:hypothetical protein
MRYRDRILRIYIYGDSLKSPIEKKKDPQAVLMVCLRVHLLPKVAGIFKIWDKTH